MQAHPTKPFTRSQALAAGMTVAQLASPRYVRVFHNAYLPAGAALGAADRARAALMLSAPGAYVSHHTAGALWKGWTPDAPETHLSFPPGTVRTQSRGIWAHRGTPGLVPVRRGDLLLSPPIEVFHELAVIRVDLVSLVVFGDSLVKARLTTPEQLQTAALQRAGRGSKRARQAAALVRAGVDSAPESRLRMLLVLAGLPEPTVNLILRDADGEWSRRLDLCYEGLKIVVEYDGRHHAKDLQQWNRDLLRREELERQGWIFVVVTADALFNDPASVVMRVAEAMRARGRSVRMRSDWQAHFTNRA